MYEFEAIGTHWWIESLDDVGVSSDIKDVIQRYTVEFERRYSRFRDDSLVTMLSQNGVLYDPPHELLEMLAFARTMFHTTEGAFSPFVGNDLENLGYGKPLITNTIASAKCSKSPKRHDFFNAGVTWDKAAVHVEKGTVLDFGGFGKGWLIDEYVKILCARGVRKFIVNGGGDLYIQSDVPVDIALEDPYDSTKKIGVIKIQKGALAASSIVKRSWEDDDKTHHHIIDPSTGRPTDSRAIASFVLADTALVADTLATVLIVAPELENAMKQSFHVKTKIIKDNQI